MSAAVLDSAFRYLAAGLSVIPVGPDKRPTAGLLPGGSWKPYQSRQATPEEVVRWFSQPVNVAVICGAVSGNLFVWDFDEPQLYESWRARVGDLAASLVIQESGRGYHAICRLPAARKGAKIAWVADPSEQPAGRRIGIESRGEGHCIVVAPSIHTSGRQYRVVQGDLARIPVLAQEHFEMLMRAAYSLDECPFDARQVMERSQAANRPNHPEAGGVIGAYNQSHSIGDALAQYGYAIHGQHAVRPGGERFTVFIEGNRSFHHNTNDVLSDGYWTTPFDAYCTLEHGGDVLQAVKTAASELGMSHARPRTMASDEEEEEVLLAHDLTDIGNGERLAERHSDQMRHVSDRGWLIWNGKHWEHDRTGQVARFAKATALSIKDEATPFDEMAEQAADELSLATARKDSESKSRAIALLKEAEAQAKQIRKWAANSQSQSRLKAMIEMAASEPSVVACTEHFNRDPWLVCCSNGTLDLKSGELRPHAPEDLITRALPTAYNASAECPTWGAFLSRIFAGDEAMLRFVQRAAGYTLTGLTTEQCLFFCYGTGKNGKSTFAETLLAMLGSYARKTPAETLLARRNAGIPNDLAALDGARLVVGSELPQGRRLNEALVKDLTGGDTISARFLHKEYFDFRPQFKLWLYGNYKPRIQGADDGIWRRMRLIPFTVTILDEERDARLPRKLLDELPGVLAWAVRGCLKWQQEGLNPPTAVVDATASYRADEDMVTAYLEERTVKQPGALVMVKELYADFKDWAESYGETVLSHREFSSSLKLRGYENRPYGTNSDYHWFGLGLVAGQLPAGS